MVQLEIYTIATIWKMLCRLASSSFVNVETCATAPEDVPMQTSLTHVPAST
jgi:hypothetical protein